jgi:precorrin-6Y C5,15-methyltransferase (decarboxylating)
MSVSVETVSVESISAESVSILPDEGGTDLVRAAGTAVTVIGVDASVPTRHGANDGLPGGAGPALAGARLVVGAARHLAAAAVPDAAASRETVVLGPLEPALRRIRAAVRAGDRVVVLASGDPGFFGIVRRLRAEGLPVRVLPAVSSVAAAFARAGLPWDGAAVVTAHGRELRPALNACRALPAVAVLTEPGAGAAELGAGLAGWPRRMVVVERLGGDDERCREVTPEQAAGQVWADPHVTLVLRDPAPATSARADNQPAAAPSGGWALPEHRFEHRDSMITKAEVRALAVARLRPRLGRLVWDVGAGSGSVGIECGLLGAAVVAVDDDPDACEQVHRNAQLHGVDVRVVAGAAPGVLDGLPVPDAVFVGGGGQDAVAAVAGRPRELGPDRIVVALAAVDRVQPCADAMRGNGFTVDGVQLATSRLADLPGGSLRLAATNPVFLLTGERS